MIVVCKDFDERLDTAWYKLQLAIADQYENSISQHDCDEESVMHLERLAEKLAASRKMNELR